MGASVLAYGECFGCQQVFAFHPNRVPSIRVEGARHPICRACVALVNPRRQAAGLAPIVILPGAYDPADESDIVWGD